MKKQILFLVWLLCLMPFSLIGQENQENSVKLKPAQMTGWKAKGLNGNVKVVTSADGESITFNQLANITCYQIKDNVKTYTYINPRQYKDSDGPAKYDIVFTNNTRKEFTNEPCGGTHFYTFDKQSRVIEHLYVECHGCTETYFYNGNETLPYMSMIYSRYEDGGVITINTFQYIDIDSHGNWTRRKVSSTTRSTEILDDAGAYSVSVSPNEVRIETRTIIYYPAANSSSSAQPAQQQQNKAPRFPGGESAMVKFFTDNANPRKPAIATAGYGEVIVEFTVTEEGTIEDAKWKGRVSVSMDQEALRLVNMMPKWNPGFVDGQPAKMKVQVGLRFFPNQAFRYIKAMLY